MRASPNPTPRSRRVGPLTLLLLAACAAGVGPDRRVVGDDVSLLRPVRSWAIQLQSIEAPGAPARLEHASVDMLVIDAVRSVRGMADFATRDLVARLGRSAGPNVGHKRCLCYLNVGQAEDYRDYWGADWKPPQDQRPGTPDFVLAPDPDGWAGDHQVSFWDPRWKRVLFGAPDALLDRILADGFDGVYLDWVLAYRDPAVVAAAQRAGVDPARAMVELIGELRDYARARSPLFVVIAQNGVELGEHDERFYSVIDGFAHEDLTFRGTAGAAWDDPQSADVAMPDEATAQLAAALARFVQRGVPVFTLDYASRPDGVESAFRVSRAHGFVPCVTRAPLDRLPAIVR